VHQFTNGIQDTLQRQRFPEDAELDIELAAIRARRLLAADPMQSSLDSDEPIPEGDLDRIQRELDEKAERYARAPEEAPTEPDF